jgi:hypothetical protein
MGVMAAAILLFLGTAAGAEELVFALEEVSVVELVEQTPSLASGHQAACSDQPQPAVRAYPALKSDKPVYGSAQFGSFFEERDPALLYHFVVDESGGPDAGYDRLYVDLDGDRDLSNDAPVSPRKDVPAALLQRFTSIVGQVLFEDVGIPLPCDAEGTRPLEVTPRLLLIRGGGAMFSFVPTHVRRGRIEIDGCPFDVLLAQTHPICGWLDHPETGFRLMSADTPGTKPPASTLGKLMVMRRLGEQYYRFAASPAGDKLIVRPYEGPMGDFEIGGGRKFETTDIVTSGWLRSRDTMVQVEGPKCWLPAGDYALYSATITHGDLTFSIEENDHSDGGFRSKLYHARTCPIHIRQGECFVLDFSNPVQIVFADPPKECRVRVGQKLFVEAVLTDPILDVAFSDLTCIPANPAGEPAEPRAVARAGPRNTPLNPRVTISRSNGGIVSEGVMGYG